MRGMGVLRRPSNFVDRKVNSAAEYLYHPRVSECSPKSDATGCYTLDHAGTANDFAVRLVLSALPRQHRPLRLLIQFS